MRTAYFYAFCHEMNKYSYIRQIIFIFRKIIRIFIEEF